MAAAATRSTTTPASRSKNAAIFSSPPSPLEIPTTALFSFSTGGSKDGRHVRLHFCRLFAPRGESGLSRNLLLDRALQGQKERRRRRWRHRWGYRLTGSSRNENKITSKSAKLRDIAYLIRAGCFEHARPVIEIFDEMRTRNSALFRKCKLRIYTEYNA